MTSANIPDLLLPGEIMIPGSTLEQFLWSGRERGLEWLAALPDVLAEWLAHWRITLDPAPPELSMNLVLFGTSDLHGPIVIKTSPPHREITAEIDALEAHASPRIVNLIDADPSVSIMLQRRILPGETLRSHVETGRLTERDAAGIAADLLHEYWVEPSPNASFLRLDEWFRALYAYRDRYPRGGGRLPHPNVELAIRCADELLASQRDGLTLHGDLHHDNILLDRENGWTIIDPKGLIGERGYDIGQWMVNPIGVDRHPDLAHLTDARLDWFADLLDIERDRLWQWAMVQTVLGDCWNLESDIDTSLYAQPIASILANLPEARRV